MAVLPARLAAAFSDVLLRDRLLVLCHLSVAPQMREGLSHLAAMQSAMQGLRAMGGQEQDAGAGGQMLAETRRQCREQFARSLRAHEWTQCWLLSPWRQQAAFVLAVSTAQLVEAVSRQRSGGQLLRYVPELYVGAMLDMVRRAVGWRSGWVGGWEGVQTLTPLRVWSTPVPQAPIHGTP